jgi:hypothetical protein
MLQFLWRCRGAVHRFGGFSLSLFGENQIAFMGNSYVEQPKLTRLCGNGFCIFYYWNITSNKTLKSFFHVAIPIEMFISINLIIIA